MKYIVANWKAHLGLSETKHWVDEFLTLPLDTLHDQVTLVLCPPHPYLAYLHEKIVHANIVIGSQDVSEFNSGAYTGEVPAQILSEYVTYAILGHSERRAHHNETDETVNKKSAQATQAGIIPIICVRGKADVIPPGAKFIAFEPEEAIGTGNNLALEDVKKMREEIGVTSEQKYLYGGSVNESNASVYLSNTGIDGLLVGGASLSPASLYKIASFAPNIS